MKPVAAGLVARFRAALRVGWTRAMLVLLAVVVCYGSAWWTAHHVTDTVAITASQYVIEPASVTGNSQLPPGRVTTRIAFSETIHNAATAGALQFIVNSTGTLPAEPSTCGNGGGTYSFSLRFSWLGATTQQVTISTLSCSFVNISTLGIDSPVIHRRPDPATWRQIEHLTGMPDFGNLSHGGVG